MHFHMLFLDGVYVEGPDGSLTFRWVKAPTSAELTVVAGRIASRVGRFLERQGLLERDAQRASLSELALDDEPMQALLAHSITYRIAVGPRAGRKVFTLQSLPPGDEGFSEAPGKVGGFSLHAGVAARADERGKLERLCRYITRPAIANERLKRNPAGQIVLQLKSPYRDGTTHIVMSPLEFMQRLAALVPRPRLHLIRFHGVLAPHAKLRAEIVPSEPVNAHEACDSPRPGLTA